MLPQGEAGNPAIGTSDGSTMYSHRQKRRETKGTRPIWFETAKSEQLGTGSTRAWSQGLTTSRSRGEPDDELCQSGMTAWTSTS